MEDRSGWWAWGGGLLTDGGSRAGIYQVWHGAVEELSALFLLLVLVHGGVGVGKEV